jgi:glyoxylase-like metal-dependent hydrolase (beta-lactamase superfamily II)
LALLACGCVASQHATAPSALGVARSSDELVAVLDQPGPIALESVDSADWEVPLSGCSTSIIPNAKAAGLADRAEKIVVRFHVIEHPARGMFIVDTGVERAVHDPDRAAVRGLVASYMAIDEKLVVREDLATFLARHGPLAGVFLTHLHLDHVMGMPDVPPRTPIYAGPGETTPRSLQNVVMRPNLERLLAGHEPIAEWKFVADSAGRFDGIVDVFGDGSLWALWCPAILRQHRLSRAHAQGPVLLTGDASHTRWGWDHDVAPGTYSGDPSAAPRASASCARSPPRIRTSKCGSGTNTEPCAKRCREHPGECTMATVEELSRRIEELERAARRRGRPGDPPLEGALRAARGRALPAARRRRRRPARARGRGARDRGHVHGGRRVGRRRGLGLCRGRDEIFERMCKPTLSFSWHFF